MFQSVLVVCTGNICRSPIAAALLARRLNDAGKQVDSAGVAALIGAPAAPYAQEVMRERGYDLSDHRGRQLTAEMLAQADLVLALDETHRRWILDRFTQFRGRVHKLGKWRDDADVADPFQRPKAAFEEAYLQIADYVEDWLPRLLC